MGSGLRISEALSLKIDDIKNEYIVVLGKGKKERLIPLISQVKKVLLEWIMERSKIKSTNCNNVFINFNGKKITSRYFQKFFQIKK